MATLLHIGITHGTNRLRIESRGWAVGEATNQNTAFGFPPAFGVAVNRNVALAIGNPEQKRNGIATNRNSAVAQAHTNIGFGYATNRNLAMADLSLGNGLAQNINVAEAEGYGFRKFAPMLLFSGYVSDGTSITIPIADLIGLTAAEADAVTGDWREILQAILLHAVEYHRSFVWSERPRTYNAFGMNLFRTQTLDRHFGITFYTDMGAPNVAPEP
jgi:hypothetical protein